MSEMPKAPTYFFYDAKLNSVGEMQSFDSAINHSNKKLSPEDFKKKMDGGCLCIDNRHNLEGGLIKGAYLMTEKGAVASWAGLIIPPNSKIVLFTETGQAEDMIERLLRIGYFNIEGFNDFSMNDWKAKGYETMEVKQVDAKQMKADEKRTNLDVRNLGEWRKGYIDGAKCITLGEIPTRH